MVEIEEAESVLSGVASIHIFEMSIFLLPLCIVYILSEKAPHANLKEEQNIEEKGEKRKRKRKT